MYQDNFFNELIIDNFAGGGGASVGIELATTKEVEKEIVRRETQANTVRKMQERIKKELRSGNAIMDKSIADIIDQIAKEIIDESTAT